MRPFYTKKRKKEKDIASCKKFKLLKISFRFSQNLGIFYFYAYSL